MQETLKSISGNHKYETGQDAGYALSEDNYIKMCLIVLRMRQNIPISIMGEAGVGKTALLRHVVKFVYQDEFMVMNVHAGVTSEDISQFLEEVEKKV